MFEIRDEGVCLDELFDLFFKYLDKAVVVGCRGVKVLRVYCFYPFVEYGVVEVSEVERFEFEFFSWL